MNLFVDRFHAGLYAERALLIGIFELKFSQTWLNCS